MLGRLWPRFALEACFLVAVALVAGLLDLTVQEIFVVMAVAYLLTVVFELAAWRRRRRAAEAAAVPAETTIQAPEPTESPVFAPAVRVREDAPPPRAEEDEARLDEIAPADEPAGAGAGAGA